LLVPELAAGAAAEVADLREACVAAAGRLARVSTRWIALGSDPAQRRDELSVHAQAGSFRGFGVDVRVGLTPRAELQRADPDMPLPLLIAGWLREHSDRSVAVTGRLVPLDLGTADCTVLGAELATELAQEPEPTALLVLGDGASTHTARAPGYLDDRAGPFDELVAKALATADTGALLRLIPELGDELGAVGRAPWQVLAAAVERADAPPGWRGELLYSAAPYGVAYHVAVWDREHA
jgi:hypothetical protein